MVLVLVLVLEFVSQHPPQLLLYLMLYCFVNCHQVGCLVLIFNSCLLPRTFQYHMHNKNDPDLYGDSEFKVLHFSFSFLFLRVTYSSKFQSLLPISVYIYFGKSFQQAIYTKIILRILINSSRWQKPKGGSLLVWFSLHICSLL